MIDPTISKKMVCTESSLSEQFAALEAKAIDQFSRMAIEGARHALADCENPLRLNFFSNAMRIMFEHMTDTLSPTDMVSRSSWFTVEREDGKPTRKQCIVFAIQGGFSDAFMTDELHVDPLPLRHRLVTMFKVLSEQVHAGENTIIQSLSDQNLKACSILAAMAEFLDAVHECRAAVLRPVAEALDQAAVEVAVSEAIQEVDELAGHYCLDEV
jgi:hypothetical protein